MTPPCVPRWTLKTAQGQYGYLIVTRTFRRAGYHRQDVKGLRWMPWHQESMKDVDGCDKPRLGAEQPLTRGFPNGETRRR